MQYNIAFYIHHHGAGHFMRSLAIANEMQDCKITFLGSSLEAYKSLIPDHIQCIDLPLDLPTATDHFSRRTDPAALHYAPHNVLGQRKRVSKLADFFSDVHPLLLVVDVSVEVAMLASLCGVPYIAVRQHGKRDDEAHRIAYANAIGLLAPYGKELQPTEPVWLNKKTLFSGGFSRFSPSKAVTGKVKVAAVLIGSGGTSFNSRFIKHLALNCPDWYFHIIGKCAQHQGEPMLKNVRLHGIVENPEPILRDCCIVLGNAGHNTVMEMAALNKRLIVIPEDRPFDEQREKSAMLSKMGFVMEVDSKHIYDQDWNSLLNIYCSMAPNWGDTIEADALKNAVEYLKAKFEDCFSD